MRQTGKKRNIRSLFGFELFIKVACLSFSFPLFRGMLNICLWAAGYSYVTKENVVRFILSPCVLLCFLLTLMVVSFLVLLEMNAVCMAVQYGRKGYEISFQELFFGSVKETVDILQNMPNNPGMVLRCLLFVSVVNLPSILFVLLGLSRIESMAERMPWVLGLLLLMLGLAGIMGLVLTKRRSILHRVLRNGLVLFLFESIVYFAGIFFCVFIAMHTTSSALSGGFFLRLFERYHLICGILFASVNTVVYEYVCGGVVLRKKKECIIEKDVRLEKAKGEQWKKICLWVSCVIVIVMTVVQTVSFFRNKSVIFSEVLEELCITAHRGASSGAPENTMAAIALAVEEGADYAEIDVRLTADGVPVLLHDRALFRTTRVLKDVDCVTYEELSQYDAGSSYSIRFSGERVPRLDAVLEEFGGQIGFNIELKTKDDIRLAQSVVTLIEEYGLEASCIITSSSYQQLEWVKEMNRTIKTGYILSMVYGDFYKSEAADFFSIRSGYVTEGVVKKAHALGKEIHAWNVNQEGELKRMRAIGVDNIITDRPAYAREIVQRNALAETFSEWVLLLLSQK